MHCCESGGGSTSFQYMILESQVTEEELYPDYDELIIHVEEGDNSEYQYLEYAYLRSDGWVRAKTSDGKPIMFAPANIVRIRPRYP